MKLWLLRPVDERAMPWNPWYDKCFGFVVRAETEAEARAFANKNGGDEVKQFHADRGRGDTEAWIKPEYSTCVELTPDGEAGVVIEDFHSA